MNNKERILDYLGRNPMTTGARMISNMKLPRGSISATLHQLEKAGLIVATLGQQRGVFWSLAVDKAEYPAWLEPGIPSGHAAMVGT